MPHIPKNIEVTFSFPKFVASCKNQFISTFHYWDNSILEPRNQINHTHFWPFSPKAYRSDFNSFELVPTCKMNRLFHWIVLEIWRFHSFKNPAIWWQRAFWPISQKQDFYQTQVTYRNTTNNVSFHYILNSINIKG